MNDPNKRIDVNISSLLSLKAELLRKKEEVSKAKIKQTIEPFIPKKSTKPPLDKSQNDEQNEKSNNENYVIEYEDSALLDRSRKVLEAKSRFYDKMIATGGNLNSDDNCLVLFNQKQQDSKPGDKNSNYDSSSSGDDDDRKDKHDYEDDEEWVEYTDCLGRTRKCLKKDLEFFKKKDSQLADNIQPRVELNQNAPMWMIDTKGSSNDTKTEIIDDNISELTSVVSKHDQMKMNWEKKEEENIHKENVHYQDVLFDEARQHGVGYYAFSTDEEERAKQRKALDELRGKTLAEQKQRELQREQREKMIAERVKAAKNRQRARLGLPPLEDEPETVPPEEKLYDTKEEEKKKKKEEKLRRKKEKEEKLREEERKNHVRPWDRNKDGVKAKAYSSDSDEDGDDDGVNNEWQYKPEREPMSQEQWNEMKRNERNMDFAPVPEKVTVRRSFRSQPIPPASDIYSSNDYDDKMNTIPETLYFTTKKSSSQINNDRSKNKEHPRSFIKRNYSSAVSSQEDESEKNTIPIQIRNELDEDNDDDGGRDLIGSATGYSRDCGGVEIPPPPTFEYYGPSGSKRGKPAQKPNLEKSIEAGLKFLRNRSDKGILPVKSSWTANASNVDF